MLGGRVHLPGVTAGTGSGEAVSVGGDFDETPLAFGTELDAAAVAAEELGETAGVFADDAGAGVDGAGVDGAVVLTAGPPGSTGPGSVTPRRVTAPRAAAAAAAPTGSHHQRRIGARTAAVVGGAA